MLELAGQGSAAFCLEFFSAAAVFGQGLSGLHFYDLMTQITQFLPLTAHSHLGTDEVQTDCYQCYQSLYSNNMYILI